MWELFKISKVQINRDVFLMDNGEYLSFQK